MEDDCGPGPEVSDDDLLIIIYQLSFIVYCLLFMLFQFQVEDERGPGPEVSDDDLLLIIYQLSFIVYYSLFMLFQF